MSKGKQRATASAEELDSGEVFKIINQTNILHSSKGPGNSSTNPAFEIVRPSQLDALRGVSPSQKLVELDEIDDLVPSSVQVDTNEQDDLQISEAGERLFYLLLNLIVFGTLWLCMDMMIHAQYGQTTSVKEELGRSMDVLPGLAFIVWLTLTYPSHILTRLVLFLFSTVGGSHMIWMINSAGYLKVMRRCPAVGTLWIWAVVQLDLPTAVLSLVGVFAYTRYRGLNIIFG